MSLAGLDYHALTRLAPRVEWIAQRLAFAIAGLIGVLTIFAVATNWTFADTDAYWNAALRLRDGQPLYPQLADPGADDVYRYSPWFAWVWVPLTFLPRDLVYWMWGAALVVSVVMCIIPAIQTRRAEGYLLALILGPLLFRTASSGNVQPLMLAGIVWGLSTRWGPLAIAIAASLKAVPVLLVTIFIGRRQWGRAAVTLGLTALLVAPMLAFDLSAYPLDASGAMPPLPFPIIAVLAAGSAVMASRGGRYTGLWAVVAVVAATPRWLHYQPAWLLAAVPARSDTGGTAPA